MKVTFVVGSLHGGGAEYVARTWMGWLAQQGHSVSAVLTGRPIQSEYVPEGITVQSLASVNGQAGKVRALKQILRAEKPDVGFGLQMHSNLTLLAAARLLSSDERPKIVISERNLVSLGLPAAKLAHRVKVRAAKCVYRHADAVVAISHPVAGELVAGFRVPGDRVVVVPNPATAKVKHRIAVRRLEESNGDRLTLVLPCRLVSQKRPELALLAAAELERRNVRTNVISFGEGPLLRDLEALATLQRVEFRHLGWVENWTEEVPTNSVVILPSAREGFGNVLVEAAAAGFPSVAVSGALGVADAIVPGLSGQLALTAKPSDIADAVLGARELPVTGISDWLERFSPESSGADLERVLGLVVRGEL